MRVVQICFVYRRSCHDCAFSFLLFLLFFSFSTSHQLQPLKSLEPPPPPPEAMDLISSKLINPACCQVCRRIFSGTWIPWRGRRIPAARSDDDDDDDDDSRWKIYEFHKTFRDLKNCATGTNHTCPLCKIVLERGHWDGASDETETTFSCIPVSEDNEDDDDDDYLSINVTPNGGTFDLLRCCFITMKKCMFSTTHLLMEEERRGGEKKRKKKNIC